MTIYKRRLHVLGFLILVCCSAAPPPAEANGTTFSLDQQLIIAAFELNVSRVKELIARGANVNSVFGTYDRNIFRDKRSLGYSHVGSSQWTALQAVANSNRAPQPERETENTAEARTRAEEETRKIDPKLIAERENRRVAIAKLLIAAGAKLDLADTRGATALASAVYAGHDELALLLINSNAAVNTRTGIYIDGAGDVTPLHNAANSPRVLKALLEKGATVSARNSEGDTPLHLAALHASPDSVSLLIRAGADIRAKDNEGRTPLDWVRGSATEPDFASQLSGATQANRVKVEKLLRQAGAK